MTVRKETDRSWIGPFLFGLAFSVPLSLLVIWITLRQQDLTGARPAANPIHPAAVIVNGPGGRIEALRIPLANPGGRFPDEEQRLKPATWFFEGYSAAQLEAFFLSLPNTVRMRNTLLMRERWQEKTNGWVVQPAPATIWSLPSDVRQRLYSVLAKSPENYAQHAPFRFPAGGFAKGLAASGLSLRRIQQLEQLTYIRDGVLCFSDLDLAREVLRPTEFQRVVDLLYQTPTYRLRLHVSQDADVDELVRYWGRGGRGNLIHPLLKSLTRVPNGASTSVSILLPAYARLHLYTYPQAWREPTATQQDCFYTALNFFNEVPNTNFFNMDYAVRVLASEYTSVMGEPTFGDIVILHDPAGNMIHACVYIVADFVFTKNGSNSNQPWVFMNLQDVLLAYHGAEGPRQVSVFRRQDQDPEPPAMAIHSTRSMVGRN